LPLLKFQPSYVTCGWAKFSFKTLEQVVRVITTNCLKQNSASTKNRRFFSFLSTLSRRFIKLLHRRFRPHRLQFIIH